MIEKVLLFINKVFVSLVYRVNKKGLENIPKKGGALLVCNHASLMDASILLAASPRPLRFLMYRPIYERWWIKPFAKVMGAIPVEAKSSPEEIKRSLQAAQDSISEGQLVCIFAEGGLTRLGNLKSFKRGMEAIAKGQKAPIIPTCLDRLWGSIFSHQGGKVVFKWPRELPYKAGLRFDPAVSPETSAWDLRSHIQSMAADLAISRAKRADSLARQFVKVALSRGNSLCIEGEAGQSLTYSEVLGVTQSLESQLSKLKVGKRVGVLLPPSFEAAVINLSILYSGRVPVNLNSTSGLDNLSYSVSSAGLSQVIVPGGAKCAGLIDALGSQVEAMSLESFSFKKQATLKTVFEGFKFLCSSKHKRVGGKEASIFFSSGSTGKPKGVILSHGSLYSNVEGLQSVFDLSPRDKFIGTLPFFHAFGFMGTFLLPLLSGASVSFHSNPLDAKGVISAISAKRSTVLLSTPSFLRLYMRSAETNDFKSLRYVISGAERLSPNLAESFREKFGLLPLEGYGATELSPVASMSLPDFRKSARSAQVGNKLGKVGHPLPGVAAKVCLVGVENPETVGPLGIEEEGMLWIKGPNQMISYLGKDKETTARQTQWYQTGDLAKIDFDGFIEITGRLARHSKVAGEMVPHGRVEEEILKVSQSNGFSGALAVCGKKDEARGERIVVFYVGELDESLVSEKLRETSLPKLWLPKPKDFFQVDELPLLPTGKLDLVGLRKLAENI